MNIVIKCKWTIFVHQMTMKKIQVILFVFASMNSSAQSYAKQNINLLGLISPNTSVSNVNKYSGCWGWYQAGKNKEYAISGASNGTYFIDITNPATPSVSAFVPSKSTCTWREMKTYKHYAYIVSDVCKPNAFQIVDLQYLPDSVHIVHNDTTLFTLGHTIWIDNDKMWVASTRFNSTESSPMTVWSLVNPEAPVLLRRLEQDISSIVEVHDMYVRNDTAFVSAGWSGLRVLKLNSNNTFTQLGSYTGYQQAGYNHSSALTQNGKYLVFCDEVPESKPIHFVDVQNLSNIQPLLSWHPHPKTTPHNPFIIGNKWAIVSSYQDGLFIYDISNPNFVKEVGFFDTFNQGGYVNPATSNYGSSPYNGNWGAYPFLPSKVIIANDMANGVFLLDATAAYTATNTVPVGIADINENPGLSVYPNPAKNELNVIYKSQLPSAVSIQNMLGGVVFERTFNGDVNEQLDVSGLSNGTYLIRIASSAASSTNRLVICR
jgi:choice-of-anchor B domain-containing protein